MKKRKVLLIIPSVGMGGAENIVVNIAKFIDKTKFDIKIVSLYSLEHCSDKYKRFIQDNKIDIVDLKKKKGLDISIIVKLFKLFRHEKPDIIHTHLYSCVYALIPEVLCGINVRIHTVHNMAEKEIPALYQKIMKVAYQRMNVIPVGINRAVKDSIVKCYGLNESDVPVVENGVDLSKFFHVERKENIIRLINVGRFSKQKNHHLLIRCLEEVVKINQNIHLVLVGEGELKTDIEQLISKKGLQSYVTFTGNVSNVETFLSEADIYVMTSDYEGMPLCIIEAMAAELPVVSTKAGGVVDLLADGENSILTEVGDIRGIVNAILTLATNADMRARMGKASKEMSVKYSVENMVKEYEDLYKGIGNINE